MGPRIGIIAGSGEFPFLVLEEAKKLGYACVVAGIRGEAEPGLEKKVQLFEWVDVGDVVGLVSFFKRVGVDEAVFAGRIDRRIIFKKEKYNETSFRLLAQSEDKSPSELVKTIIDYITWEGIQIKDPTPFISACFCQEGILSQAASSSEVEEDIAFGWKIAKKIADLDIGQTVIIKDKAVVAVEGMEGTDEAIRRGGTLAGDGVVAVKVSRSFQDPRIDLPAVGLNTIKSLVEVRGRALCFEAAKVPFFQRDKAIALADANGISVIVKKA